MNAWSRLPNAARIDRILTDLRARPQAWDVAWGAARDAAWDAARAAAWAAARAAALNATRGAARGAARAAARDAALDAAWGAARGAARDAARDAAWGAARDATLALIAWDDAAGLLAMPVRAVRLFAAAGDPRAVLLLPAVIALNPSTEDS